MRKHFPHQFVLSALLLTALLAVSALTQTIVGRISGTVTDATGATLPGAKVQITNEATGITRDTITDPNGFFVVTNLPVGHYRVTVEADGFKKATRTGYDLVADGRLTVDFKLETGAVTETIEVVASTGETVNSTSGEVARVIDQSQVQELALNGRNYMQLASLIPGAPLIGSDDALALTTSLSVSQPINGSRGISNNLTVDGGFNLDSGSNGSQINNVGIDFIREVNIKTSNFSAEYGRNSGASINVVTRGGGNKFNGSAFEYLRNEKLDANNFFNNSRRLNRAPLRFNNFGWSLGGPIIKDKFFFFAGMEWKYIRQFTAANLRTLPTRAERDGDFSFRLRGPDGVVGTADDGVLRNPANALNTCVAPVITNGVVTTQANRTGCFAGNKIPMNLITPDGRAIANVYTAMEKAASSYVDNAAANNALFQGSNPFNFRQEIVRLDYRFNERHTMYGRYLHDDYNLIDPFGTFINSQLPTIQTNRRRPGYGIQVAHTWLLKPTLINEAKITTSWNRQRIPPVGEAWKRETYGFQFKQLFANGGVYENSIPQMSVAGYASWRGAAQALLSPTTDIAVLDNISYVRRSHALKVGFAVIRNRKDQNGRPDYAGNFNFSSDAGNPNRTFQAFADALLGNFRTYAEADIDPIGFFRFTQYEAYASDNWKLNRKLSIEFGVRYQYGIPTYAQGNNLANFDPALYDPSKAVTVLANGTIDAMKGGNRLNGIVRTGEVPPSELNRIPTGNSALTLSVPATGRRGIYAPQHLFMPRFSFAFAPFNDNKTAIRGGFGMFYDRPEGNLIYSTANLPPFSNSGLYENGNAANLASARASAPAPFANISSINPNLEVPYQMNYSLSIQREMPKGIFVEAAYVGNLGRHLIRQPDINQPSFSVLRANALLPSAQRRVVNAMRPYKGYSAILFRLSDSNSNYNSLQLYAAKRKGNLTMTASYTWSKALGDSSGNGDNPEDPFNRAFNYGPLSFDRRHVLVGTYTYRLPQLRGSNGFVKNAFGGWEVSGITRFQTGAYLTPTANSSIGNRRADVVLGQPFEGDKTVERWFNTAAFAGAVTGSDFEDRRGTAGVGILEGPRYRKWDVSLRKWFTLSERFRLQFQGDMFNMFNNVNFNNPTVNLASLDYGRIGSAQTPRQVQMALRLTF
jgi:hypothetical protein